jgi:hypothetical protein
MSRVEVGDGEAIALLSLRTTSIPESFETAFVTWRNEALAAAGLDRGNFITRWRRVT